MKYTFILALLATNLILFFKIEMYIYLLIVLVFALGIYVNVKQIIYKTGLTDSILFRFIGLNWKKTPWDIPPKWSTIRLNMNNEFKTFYNTVSSYLTFSSKKDYTSTILNENAIVSKKDFMKYVMYANMTNQELIAPKTYVARGNFISKHHISDLLLNKKYLWKKEERQYLQDDQQELEEDYQTDSKTTHNHHGLLPGQYKNSGVLAIALSKAFAEYPEPKDLKKALASYLSQIYMCYQKDKSFYLTETMIAVIEKAKSLSTDDNESLSLSEFYEASKELHLQQESKYLGGCMTNDALNGLYGLVSWSVNHSEEELKKAVFGIVKLTNYNFASCQIAYTYLAIMRQLLLWKKMASDCQTQIISLFNRLVKEPPPSSEKDFLKWKGNRHHGSEFLFLIKNRLHSALQEETTENPKSYELFLAKEIREYIWELEFTTPEIQKLKSDMVDETTAFFPEYVSALSSKMGGNHLLISALMSFYSLFTKRQTEFYDTIGSVLAIGHHSEMTTNMSIVGSLYSASCPNSVIKEKDIDCLFESAKYSIDVPTTVRFYEDAEDNKKLVLADFNILWGISNSLKNHPYNYDALETEQEDIFSKIREKSFHLQNEMMTNLNTSHPMYKPFCESSFTKQMSPLGYHSSFVILAGLLSESWGIPFEKDYTTIGYLGYGDTHIPGTFLLHQEDFIVQDNSHHE
jgi:hypothetical protein